MSEEIRWHYRHDRFGRALRLLRKALENGAAELNPLEQEGLVQRFEYTFELGWKLLKDRLEHEGVALDRRTPREVIRAAFKAKLIHDGDLWMDMLADRNATSHQYDDSQFEETVENIELRYFHEFERLHEETGRELAES